jgi:outer membrane receptor protein involved in Fe transport
VNIIMRKDFVGAEVTAFYGNSSSTDTAEQDYAFFGGAASGKARATVGLTYSARNALAARDRSFSKDADLTDAYKAKDPAKYNYGLALGLNPDLRSSTGPYATVGVPTSAQLAANGLTTAAIRNPLTGTTATVLPGTGGVPQGMLGSSSVFASVPFGSANPGRPTAAQFVPRSFVQGPLSNLYNFQEFVWLVPKTTRQGVNATFDYDLTKTLVFHSELAYQRNESETHLAPPPISTANDNSILVPASNYYNPFGIPLAFTYRPIEVGPRIANILSKSSGWLGSLKGTAGRFDYEFGCNYNTNDSRDTTTNALSESRVRAALARNTPDALNIFGGPNFKNDPATINSIKIQTYSAGDASTTIFDGRVSTGNLCSIYSGDVGAAIYGEHRTEHFNSANDPISTALDDVIAQVKLSEPTSAKRDIQSVALETRLPLLRENKHRFAHAFELSAAARFERFSDGYDSGVKPFVGLRFRPFKALLLRASYGENFRAPSLPQLYAGVRESLLNGLPDLRRPQALTGDPFDGSSYQRLVRSGGNPHLTPETARTKQAGFVFDVPGRMFNGLSFDFTYGVIAQRDIITTAGADYILSNEVGGGTENLVVRDPAPEVYTNRTASSLYLLAGPNRALALVVPGQTVTVPGRIQYIKDSYLNLAYQIVRYSDYGIRYSLRSANYGRFAANTIWTYYEDFGFQRLTVNPLLHFVGTPSIPRYLGRTTLGWQRKQWFANANWVYIHRYGDMNRNGQETGRYHTFGANLSYDFPTGTLLESTRLTLGVDNLFDRQPSLFINSNSPVGYDQALVGRPQGRFGYVALKRTFR